MLVRPQLERAATQEIATCSVQQHNLVINTYPLTVSIKTFEKNLNLAGWKSCELDFTSCAIQQRYTRPHVGSMIERPLDDEP